MIDLEEIKNDCEMLCEECLAPCCYWNMTGRAYGEDQGGSTVDETVAASDFYWTDWPLVTGFDDIEESLVMQSYERIDKTGRLSRPNFRMCPFIVNGLCLIYENRPLICKIYILCQMAVDRYYAGTVEAEEST